MNVLVSWVKTCLFETPLGGLIPRVLTSLGSIFTEVHLTKINPERVDFRTDFEGRPQLHAHSSH